MTVMASGSDAPLPDSRRCWTPWPAKSTASGATLVLARR
ncbi:hypothetical protein [Klebsiella pneumoniae]|nr:hypothetical protein [Klebsiella pneumoniae]